MAFDASVGLFAGAVGLGLVHGIEPGHGWPIAASYALDRSNKWLSGLAASLVIGFGHLVSSIAMVLVFFYLKSYFELTQVNEPIRIAGVTLGGPVSIAAGVLLLLLAVREYRGHSHGHSHDHDDDHGDHNDHGDHDDHHDDHDHVDHPHGSSGALDRIASALPFVGGRSHSHRDAPDADERGLFGIATFAFALGFAHEEEFEIIALCTGSTYCLELMAVYAVAVILAIVALTLLLIAGYERYESRVERYTAYLPLFSAAVLAIMGLGFVSGIF